MTTGTPSETVCPIVVRLIGLLEAEPTSRGGADREALSRSVADLEREAVALGSGERTLTAIRAARAIVDWSGMPARPGPATAE